ncbi:MAG: hypothetical protein DSZ25_03175, partial [Thermovibrio sp.]
MELGSVTLIVAVVFSAIGIVVGIFISKLFFGKKEETYVLLEERIGGLTDKIESLVSELKEKVQKLRNDKLEEIRGELNSLAENVENLKVELKGLDSVSPTTFEVLDGIASLLREVDLKLPEIDNSLLTQIKDNFIIVRNDIETLLSKYKSAQKSSYIGEIDTLIDLISSAVSLSEKINAALVKDELLTLASSLKGEGEEIVKDLDKQAMNSKELTAMLREIKKKLEEVKD